MRVRRVRVTPTARNTKNYFQKPAPVVNAKLPLKVDPVQVNKPLPVKPDTSLIQQKIKYTEPMRQDAVLKRIPDKVNLRGAEVGVLHAETAYRVLQNRALVTHIMVDPWKVPEAGSSYALSGDNNSKKPASSHETAYQITVTRTIFAGERAVIMRMESREAVAQIPDGSLDYVFIDGDHSYDGVITDIRLWYPKVKTGGWIGGHDYDNQRTPGVKKAVDEMFLKEELTHDHEQTWFVRIK